MGADKHYRLEFRPGGVHLVIAQSELAGLADFKALILEELKKKKVDKIDTDALKAYFDNPQSESILIAPPQPEPIDGKVISRLTVSGNEVEVKVEPPMGNGVKATMSDAINSIKEAEAGSFFLDTEKIEQMLSSFRFRDFVVVGERREGRFDLTISRDKCEAILNLAPPFGGMAVEKEDVLRHLRNEGIGFGVIEEVIDKLVSRGIFNEPTVIARGIRAENGTDASLEFYFDPDEKKAKPTVDDEGKVDFRELNVISAIRKGEPLVKKTPATPGRNGKTIFGEDIPARPGRDVPFPGGQNTAPSSSDPNMIMASVDGQPKFKSNKVFIIPIIEIPGDVDFSTGNIDFTGSVSIRGSVISGFTVKAMGDIQIGGCVEIARIESGGNIFVRQGIVGMEKAIVVAKGNVSAKFIDKASVFAEGNIYVEESIMYSSVSSAGEVVLSGKKGYIIGGVVRAGKMLSANQVGTPQHVSTIIEVGGSPSMRQELEALEAEIREAEAKADMFDKSLQTMEKTKQGSGDPLAADKARNRLSIITRDKFSLLNKLRSFREKKEDIEERLSRLQSTGLKIHVRDKVMPGSKLVIKNAIWTARDEVNFSTFYERDGEMEFLPYELAGKR